MADQRLKTEATEDNTVTGKIEDGKVTNDLPEIEGDIEHDLGDGPEE